MEVIAAAGGVLASVSIFFWAVHAIGGAFGRTGL